MTLAVVLAGVAVLVVLERLPLVRFRQARALRAYVGTDVLHLIAGYGGGGLLAGAWLAWASGRLHGERGAAAWDGVPFVLQAAIALVALDLGNFVAHWLLHRSDVLWRFHEVHHSSRHLDWLATFRSHLVEQALRRVLAPLLLIVAGLPADAVALAVGVFFVWAVTNHANLRLPLGPLEAVFVTPRLHRVHHVPATTERNLGTVFTCWDRLCGTFVAADPPAKARFGLPRGDERYPQTWLGQLVAPLHHTPPPRLDLPSGR